MKSALLTGVLLLLVSGSIACTASAGDPNEVAVLETNYGRIVIEFYNDEAPKHVANFKQLAREGFYDGTKFHRLIRDKVRGVAIQGGDPNTINGDPGTWGQGQPGQKTVPAEISKKLRHVRGTVSAARRPNDINSATSQFFICASPEPNWDGEYSIFGRVIDGMNVVDTIVRAPMWPNTDRPLDPVVVNRAYIINRAELR
ncbi:MAG TPA: peptidylprolyl isomerase [Blastocatellia bacterium]|nr:peptidylprolyl isomerase [Blastocatellia bacterium]